MVQFIWQIGINLLVFLLSILIIQSGQKRLTLLGWFTAWWRQSIWSQREPKLIYASTSLGGKARFLRWLLFCRTKPKGGICLLVKWADSDFCLSILVMCSNGYVNCDKIHFRIVYLTLINCRFKNKFSYIGLVWIGQNIFLSVYPICTKALNRQKHFLSRYNDFISR